MARTLASRIARLSITAGLVLPAAAPGADLMLLTTYSSGDYGTEHDTTVHSTWVRYATGDRFQLRVALPYLQLETTDTEYVSGIGPSQRRGGGGNGARHAGQGAGGSTSEDEPQGDQLLVHEIRSSGVGDAWISGYYRVLGGGAKVFRLDTGLQAKAPIADEREGLGTGEWDYRAVVSGEYRFWSALTFATIGWSRLGDPSWIDLENPIDVFVGAETNPLLDRFVLTGWLEGSEEAVAGVGGRSAFGASLRSQGRFRWRVMATVGLSGSAEDFSVSVGMSTGIEPPKTGARGAGR